MELVAKKAIFDWIDEREHMAEAKYLETARWFDAEVAKLKVRLDAAEREWRTHHEIASQLVKWLEVLPTVPSDTLMELVDKLTQPSPEQSEEPLCGDAETRISQAEMDAVRSKPPVAPSDDSREVEAGEPPYQVNADIHERLRQKLREGEAVRRAQMLWLTFETNIDSGLIAKAFDYRKATIDIYRKGDRYIHKTKPLIPPMRLLQRLIQEDRKMFPAKALTVSGVVQADLAPPQIPQHQPQPEVEVIGRVQKGTVTRLTKKVSTPDEERPQTESTSYFRPVPTGGSA